MTARQSYQLCLIRNNRGERISLQTACPLQLCEFVSVETDGEMCSVSCPAKSDIGISGILLTL